ncbi:MAG: NAD(P)H-hydrate dehydratase [Actinobacteria bacterium]|nr:NAD(P)H-hydrate dehydratase [Actinomycetota bacterium]
MSRRRRSGADTDAAAWSEPLYTAEEMRAAEARYGGATIELMERAGRATADVVLSDYPDARSVSVWCGTGANGGDGFVVARLLREAGRDVDVVLLGSEEKVEGDARENLGRAREAGVPFVDAPVAPDVVVDALFGTGFSGAPRRAAAERIQALNDVDVPVVSVDVPSGVDASTGEAAGAAVAATKTVTFHAPKVGLLVAPGRFHAGEVEVVDIGIEPTETRHRRVTEGAVGLVPRRGARDNKYSAGSVLVVGGSRGMTGALVLTAEAAFRAGAGYVRVCFPAVLDTIVEGHLVEAVKTPATCDEEGRLNADAADAIVEASARAGAVALGPGLGRSDGTRELVRLLLERLELPLVLDADALWAVSEHHEWIFARQAATILTPHEGELARLLGRDSAWVAGRRLRAATEAADDVGATILLKGADTVVAAPGRTTFVSDLGNPGLATAGTGDVLTGIIAAFLAKRMEPQFAAAAAAAAGGTAAALAAERVGTAGMIARDVVAALSPAVSRAAP